MTDTIADQIADRFDNDGENFLDENDNWITEVLDRAAVGVDTHRDSTIYTLKDFSMIVVNELYWDTLTLLDGAEGWGLYGSSGDLYVSTDSRGVIDWYARD
jgi:hypothetical protein